MCNCRVIPRVILQALASPPDPGVMVESDPYLEEKPVPIQFFLEMADPDLDLVFV